MGKNILVSEEKDLVKLTKDLRNEPYCGFDTETYGLGWTDKLFSIQLAFPNGNAYYLNYHDYGEEMVPILPREDIASVFDHFPEGITVFAHNAKFDLGKIWQDGADLDDRRVHDTMCIERLLRNNHFGYSLDACLKRRGKAKNDKVMEWLKENKCYTMEAQVGKKQRKRNYHFDKVPFDIMFEYGCDDARDVLYLGMDQLKAIEARECENLEALYVRECRLTEALHHMERRGITVDREYTQKGFEYEQEKIKEARAEIESIAKEVYEAGPLWMQRVFKKLDIPFVINPATGNPVFDKYALASIDHPLARAIEKLRHHEQYAGTYYSSFLAHSLEDGTIHANINQGGTDTGRFSYSAPNLQNVPKEDEDYEHLPHLVRGCFVARPHHRLVMIDYDQQEFRMMLDYAGEKELIKRIMEDGVDVHQATADMMSVKRKPAKTLNFGLLYGMGIAKLAAALKVEDWEAGDLRKLYFSRLPFVKRMINGIISTAKARKFVFTWCGRRLYLPFNDPESAYKMPNHLIQGGCADVIKSAMVEIHDLLIDKKSAMLIQVHDELIFEIHDEEEYLIPQLVKIMESVYKPKNGLVLTCGAEYSNRSWGTFDRREYNGNFADEAK